MRQRIAREILGDLLHLLLIGDDAEGFFEDRLECGMHIFDRLAAEFSGAIKWDIGHRAWTIEGNERDQVFEAVGTHLAHRIAHARTFQLEHAHRIALPQHMECCLVVERDLVGVEIRDVLADEPLRLVDDCERLQAEEVEFHQPGLLNIFHVELGCGQR